MKKPVKALILAAGKSKRMKSGNSKVLHKILGKEIINHLLDSITGSGIRQEDIILIVGPENQQIKKAINRNIQYAIQDKPLGTAHAVLSARDHLTPFRGDLLVTVGDNPYITPGEISKLLNQHQKSGSPCTLISATFPHSPPPYGRIIRDQNREVIGVIEEKDASPDQLKIREVNSSIYMFDNQIVFPLLSEINNDNHKNEYYLTDIIAILKARNLKINTVTADDYLDSIGINDRWEIQDAQKKLNERNQKKLSLEQGITIFQPETVTIEYNVEIGRDTIIFPSTYIAAGTRIGKNCQIGPFVYLKGVTIPDNSVIVFEKRVREA
jgi:bifunctional UDP-N-acetylglucosamine pyrophosphorylase/glucosamine-1-phosphate N-acetyltransferase